MLVVIVQLVCAMWRLDVVGQHLTLQPQYKKTLLYVQGGNIIGGPANKKKADYYGLDDMKTALDKDFKNTDEYIKNWKLSLLYVLKCGKVNLI